MKTKVQDFNELTCKLCKPINTLIGLHNITNGDPCTTGCSYFNNGKCKGYINLSNTVKGIKSHRMTNSEIGIELNCSKRQISKMKKEGTLPDKYM